jgi:hypothetical protein
MIFKNMQNRRGFLSGRTVVLLAGCFACLIVSAAFAQVANSRRDFKVVPPETTEGSKKTSPVDLTDAKIKPKNIGIVKPVDESVEFMNETAKNAMEKTGSKFVRENGKIVLKTGGKTWVWNDDGSSLDQLSLSLGSSNAAVGKPSEEESSRLAGSAYEGDRKELMGEIYSPSAVKVNKKFVSAPYYAFPDTRQCDEAKSKFLPMIGTASVEFEGAKKALNLNNLPRCFSKKVSLWNNKVKGLIAACTNVNLLYNKLADICRANSVLSDCFVLQNILVKSCAGYKGYLGYVLAAMLTAGGVILVTVGLGLSGITLAGAGIFIVLSNI